MSGDGRPFPTELNQKAIENLTIRVQKLEKENKELWKFINKLYYRNIGSIRAR